MKKKKKPRKNKRQKMICEVEKLETEWQNLVSELGSLGRGHSLLAGDDGKQELWRVQEKHQTWGNSL